MPINLQGSGPIVEGWGRAPELQAPNLGQLVASILADRQAQQKRPLEIAKMIREQQEAESLAKYREILGQTSQEHQRLEGEQQGYMKPYYEAKTWETYNPQFAPRSGGTPRVMRQLPNGEWAPFTPGEAYKIDQQKQATQSYGALSAQEAEAQGRAAQYEKKYGVDTDAGGLKAPGYFADQATKDLFAKDQAEYFKAYQDAARIKKQRENYEKWYRGMIQQPGGAQPGAQTDEEDDGDTANASTVPPPPAAPQASPAQTGSPLPTSRPVPTATPRANMPPSSASAGGHASTYGTPAPGVTPGGSGTGQVGDLVKGSRQYRLGKWRIWTGTQWVEDPNQG